MPGPDSREAPLNVSLVEAVGVSARHPHSRVGWPGIRIKQEFSLNKAKLGVAKLGAPK